MFAPQSSPGKLWPTVPNINNTSNHNSNNHNSSNHNSSNHNSSNHNSSSSPCFCRS
jgi:hypothetical protein